MDRRKMINQQKSRESSLWRKRLAENADEGKAIKSEENDEKREEIALQKKRGGNRVEERNSKTRTTDENSSRAKKDEVDVNGEPQSTTTRHYLPRLITSFPSFNTPRCWGRKVLISQGDFNGEPQSTTTDPYLPRLITSFLFHNAPRYKHHRSFPQKSLSQGDVNGETQSIIMRHYLPCLITSFPSFNTPRCRGRKVTGHSKKSVSRTVHLFFVGLYYCFTRTRCINND